MKKVEIVVAKNENNNRQKCPVCGKIDRPESPWWFFLASDLSQPLCFNCICDREPKLLGAIMSVNGQKRNPSEQIDHEAVMLDRVMRRTARDMALDLDHPFKV